MDNLATLAQPILLVATSARCLAQKAKQAGLAVLVVDCFADEDTTKAAVACVKVSSLALLPLTTAVASLQKTYAISHIVYGSGLERHGDSLRYLQRHFTIFGNTSEVVAHTQSHDFFATLAALNIPFPTIAKQLPTSGKWLVKPLAGEGGYGIMEWDTNPIPADCYLQQYIDGQTMSLLFVAGCDGVIIYGTHRQDTIASGCQPYIFAGVSSCIVADDIWQTITNWAKKIAPALGLRGLCGIDFVVADGLCYLLEVNPRPTASMQLYSDNLLVQHLQCFLQPMPCLAYAAPVGYYRIIFASRQLRITAQMLQEKWLVDRTKIGVLVSKGQPICSIIGGSQSTLAKRLLLLNQQLYKHAPAT